MFFYLKQIIILFIFVFAANLCAGFDENSVTFGPEFEFTTKEIHNHWKDPSQYVATPAHHAFWIGSEFALAEQFAQYVETKCPAYNCFLQKTSYKHKKGEYLLFFNNSDFWIRISHDPGVLEIQTKPMTLSEQTIYGPLIEELVFNSAREMNLFSTNEEAGHFNIGFFSLFQRDKESLRRFLSFAYDIENFPELWLGGLGEFRYSAPPLSLKKARTREIVSQSIFNLNEHELRLEGEQSKQNKRKIPNRSLEDSIFEFLSDFRKIRINPSIKKKPKFYDEFHNQALNINNVLSVLRFITQRHNGFPKNPINKDLPGGEDPRAADGPVSLRGIRAQKSFHDFNLLSRLFLLRYKYLESKNFPVKYLENSTKNPSPSDIKTAFFLYVTEAGGNYNEFKSLLPSKIQKAALNPYIRALFFPSSGAVVGNPSTPRLPQNQMDFLNLKKLLPMVATSDSILFLFFNLFDRWATAQEQNIWMAALLKEVQNITLRFYSHNAPVSIVFAEFYFLITKIGHSVALYLSLASKPGAKEFRLKKEMTRFLEKNSLIIDFSDKQNRLFELSFCQDYFLQ